MISIKDLVDTCRAIELLSYGIDITTLDNLKQYYNTKDNSLQSRVSPNIIHQVIIKLNNDVADMLEWPIGTIFKREEAEWFTIFEDALTDEEKKLKVITVDKDTFKSVMKILKKKGLVSYPDIDLDLYYPEFYKDLMEARKVFDTKDLKDCQMPKELSLAENRQNLIAMLMCAEYPEDIGKAILNAYDNPVKDFEIPALADYEVIDNRIYIKIPPSDIEVFKDKFEKSPFADKLKYIVISRNPYDFFFCSYGSNIQSCFSLNSTNFGWYGITAMSACKGLYMIYGADSKCNKINIINGKKWNVPHTYFRAWGWLAKDGKLLVDKIYYDGSWALYNRMNIHHLLSPFLGYDVYEYCNAHVIRDLKYGKDLLNWFKVHKCHMYPDSVTYGDTAVTFNGVGYGNRSFIGSCPLRRSLLDIMHTINEVAEGITYSNIHTIVNGILSNVKKCPVTGLPILPTETVSPYSKLFKDKVDGDVLVGTYCDGYFKADTCSMPDFDRIGQAIKYFSDSDRLSERNDGKFYFRNAFSNKYIPIKVFKEQMAGAVKNSPLKYVVIRYIEGDKVTYVKYRG